MMGIDKPSSRLVERYRLPETFAALAGDPPSTEQGFFRLQGDTICFGSCSALPVSPGIPADRSLPVLRDDEWASRETLPFDPDQLIDNLLLERYPAHQSSLARLPSVSAAYQMLRPMLPVKIRRPLQRVYLAGWKTIAFPEWPVDCTVERIAEKLLIHSMRRHGCDRVPFIWFWPEGHDSGAIVTHDVETAAGRDFCSRLMDMDESVGIKSSFQVIPEQRYSIPASFLDEIRARGFELNIHDWSHSGELFKDRAHFDRHVDAINRFGHSIGARGFRAGVMYRNQEWFRHLDVDYDMSVPNVAHLDPQRGGCCTVMPFFIGNLVELPLTTIQDYALFNLLQEHSTELWERQTDTIRKYHGLISILVHPDYIRGKREQHVYLRLLNHLASLRRDKNAWIARPGDVSAWWTLRSRMTLTQSGSGWRIEGLGSARARIAYAHLEGDRIRYEVESSTRPLSSSPEPQIATPALDLAGALHSSEGPAMDSTLEPEDPAATRHPLRICMVSYSCYETDNRIMRYAETLAARGDHVDVYSIRLADSDTDAVIHGVNVVKLQTRPKRQSGPISYLIPLLLFMARAAWKLATLPRGKRYDLIHVHSVPDFLAFVAFVPRLFGARILLDIHDILPELYASKFGIPRQSVLFKLLLMAERLSTAFADHVIIANDLWRERLVKRAVPSEKCTSILNFPDRTIFRARRRTRDDGRVILLYPGTLNQHQGLDLAIRAFARIRDDAPNAEFHIYGRGPDKEKLSDMVGQLGLAGRVFVNDILPLREVAKVMEDADIGVVPKRSDSFGNEAFSTKTLEFMSLGVPLIVADTAIDKFYFNDSLVRFFHSGDEDDLAFAMLELIRDGGLRSKLARNGLEFAAKNDWETHQHKYLNLVDSLLDTGQPLAAQVEVSR